ncbi:RNA polymerase sigma factor [Ktedonobacter sp. SOSP1-85]|uniref:RNA polymerase sigma factor n=1 Tax=Ktedonobacter sp. SOSP1-85 TaxID=2778367 RepID=UPI0019160914|nr:sigma-70 family RNA polymerase sigma factor [Ktedonobacter sp. SOSP1-85]
MMNTDGREIPTNQEQSASWNIPLEVYANEQELLYGLYQQEEPACTCLFKRFARQLYTLALRMTRSPEEAEEIVQESFLRACSHISDFEQRSSLRTWLYQIVSNTTLMHLRRKKPDSYSLEVAQERQEAELASEEQTPDARVLDEELRNALKLAIAQLPETLRTPFLLRSVEGLRTKEAARCLGITETTLKVRLHRARQELRQLMHSYLQEDAPVP